MKRKQTRLDKCQERLTLRTLQLEQCESQSKLALELTIKLTNTILTEARTIGEARMWFSALMLDLQNVQSKEDALKLIEQHGFDITINKEN